jgi:predicted DsbA family dithiol-disulfide isomerase
MGAAVRIDHFTDPTCPWAFSAERQRLRLTWLYGDQLTWNHRMVVLSERAEDVEASGFTTDRHAAALAMIQERFGMPIDTDERPRTAASLPACLAYVAARIHAPQQADALLRALRVRIMGGGLPDDPETVGSAAAEAGIDPAELRDWMGEDASLEALQADKAAARDPMPAARLLDHKLGGPPEERRYTCPSWEAAVDGLPAETAPGFQPVESYEVLLANMAPDLERRAEPQDVAEVLAWAGTPLATAEVALVCGLSDDEAREQLLAVADERPVGRSSYWSLRA